MPTPRYAQHVPQHLLVRILCRVSCGKTRYARVSTDHWSSTDTDPDSEVYATCLKCGYEARDPYNWMRA